MVSSPNLKQLSLHVNQGYSARLSHVPHVKNPCTGEKAEAWLHGWGLADTDEHRAGRPSPVSLDSLLEATFSRAANVRCPDCGGGPVHCRSCMVPA